MAEAALTDGPPTVTKADAYRDAASILGAKADLDKVHDHILQKFGIDMDKAQISQYRSNEKQRKRAGRKRRGRKPKEMAAMGDAAAKLPAPRFKTICDFVSTVRGWENKIGAGKICEVIEALYKR